MRHWGLGLAILAFVLGTGLSAKADDYSSTFAHATIPANQMLTFATFKNLMIDKGFTSVDAAMPELGAKYPDYLRFHTLMYASLSIQESSFEEPRALVFGPNGNFIFTFNGSAKQMGGHSFETVEYSYVTHSFKFREIVFKTPGTGTTLDDLNLSPDEVDFQNDKVLVTKANPAKCLMCHGQNASPIWATYFMWVGAYGSNDDQLYMSFDKSSWNANNEGFFTLYGTPHSQGRDMNIRKGFKDAELEGVIRYLKGKSTHPRYKYLPNRPSEVAAIEYSKGHKVDVSAEAAAEQKKYQATYDWPTRPNSVLLSLIQLMNNDRLIARLKSAGFAEGSLAKLPWKSLQEGLTWDPNSATLASDQVILQYAELIFNFLSHYKFKRGAPTLQQVQSALASNLKDEFGMQRERISQQDMNLGKGSLQLQNYISLGYDDGSGHRIPTVETPQGEGRRSLYFIKNAREFYSNLLGLTSWKETDRIAAEIETDDLIENSALQFILLDSEIDLHDYNSNLRQMSLAFHDAGLVLVYKYLGIEN